MPEQENRQLRELDWLDTLGQRVEVQNIWFNRKDVVLDGYNFRNCRFDNCHLHISSPNFEMNRCFIDETTVIHYDGQIVSVLRLFNSRHELAYEKIPAFAPLRHEDGTITIAT